MASSTKSEVHNILHCRQSRNDSRPQMTCTENFVKFGHFVFETCERTDRQTDRHRPTETLIAILRTPTGIEVIKLRHEQHGLISQAYMHNA